MTVLIYVVTSTISRCSRTKTPRRNGSLKTIRKASLSSTRSWSEPDRPPHDHVHAADSGAGDHLEFIGSLSVPPAIENGNPPMYRPIWSFLDSHMEISMDISAINNGPGESLMMATRGS
jgi:hypothetical protein